MVNNDQDAVCVILAGGPGNRMASGNTHKVCFPVAGKPAIVRAIDAYKQAGLTRFIVVVGYMAEQVISTVSEPHPEVSFVYQHDPRGTGHAASVAIEVLDSQGFEGEVIVVMGDAVIQPTVIRNLRKRFSLGNLDALVTTVSKKHRPNAGRVIRDTSGSILGIVEVPDIEMARTSGEKILVSGKALSAVQIDNQSNSANASLYAFRYPLLLKALKQLTPDNAQSEIYLTDTVEYIAQYGSVDTMLIPDVTDIMAFNTPAELLAIEDAIRSKESHARVTLGNQQRLETGALKPIGEWVQLFKSPPPDLRRRIGKIYGNDESLIKERLASLGKIAWLAMSQMGPEREVVVCRAPGRVNLMGRHIDHQGGYVNEMAVSREVLLVAAPRNDDLFTLTNMDSDRHPSREFRITEILDETSWGDWIDFIESVTVRQVLENGPKDWSHYARAPLLRLQHERPDLPLKGMDCIVGGNIPMGAGLSSSSALVVGFAEAAIALNGLNVTVRDFVDLCGEGEWFVGSRGGSADHAAIRTGLAGHVTRIGFFPFSIEDSIPMPPGIEILIIDSKEKAVKSRGAPARDIYNQRVATYKIAFQLLQQAWPPARGAMHFRDLIPDRLGVGISDLYQALARLPNRASRREIGRLLDIKGQQELNRVFESHRNIGPYDLRGVALYGLGECLRADQFAECLKSDNLQGVGQLMQTSHDGDRLYSYRADGTPRRYSVRTDDATLSRLANSKSDLSLQPGRYGCSTKKIDRIVDIVSATEGVVGAQLSGAGLGGCVMAMVHSGTKAVVVEKLEKAFSNHGKETPAIYDCKPVAGAGLIQ